MNAYVHTSIGFVQVLVTRTTIVFELYQTWYPLLRKLDQNWLGSEQLDELAKAIHNKEVILKICSSNLLYDNHTQFNVLTYRNVRSVLVPKVLERNSAIALCERILAAKENIYHKISCRYLTMFS